MKPRPRSVRRPQPCTMKSPRISIINKDSPYRWKITFIKKSMMATTRSQGIGLMGCSKGKPKSSTTMGATSSIYSTIKEASSRKATKPKAS